NAENAAHRSEKFVTMATRTRQEYLKDLVTNYSTSTPVDTGQKFSIFSSKKKDKIQPRFIPDSCQRGAILWLVLLEDNGQGQRIDCFLGISTDTFVLIEEHSRQIVFVTPCKSILGWYAQSNSLRIYHHQGECMTIYMRDLHGNRDELVEIMDRLAAVTSGVKAMELSINRNIMGQLGFHVQPDGIVTLVESQGQAWQAGLKQNSRLVEICKVA
nr:putative signal-induced proliferation-associated 1-like protein 2 isoform X2 [Cucujiformia]